MMSRRPGSAAGGRPSTARPTSSSLLRRGLTADEEEEEKDASSDLTFGTSEVSLKPLFLMHQCSYLDEVIKEIVEK